MAVKCSSCGYANHNPDAKACELCHARLKPAEPKAAATALADSDDELAQMAADATDEDVAASSKPKPKAKEKEKEKADAPKEEKSGAVAVAAASAESVSNAVKQTGPLDVLLFLLSLPVSFPAALFVLLFRKADFAAVPATLWVGQGLLALTAGFAYTLSLSPAAPQWQWGVLPAIVACALVGSLALVRAGDTTAGWASAGVLVGGTCLVTGALLAMRGAPVFEGHSDAIRGLDVSADGARLVSVGEDGTLRVWNVGQRQLERTIRAHAPVAAGVRLDPSGARAVTCGGDGLVCVWDLAGGASTQRIEAHRGGALDVDLSADASGAIRLLSGGVDGAVRVWDLAASEEEAALTVHRGAVTTVAWSPDGKRAASGGADGTVTLWDPPGASQALEYHKGPVLCLAWSPDGARLVSGGEDRAVCVWTVEKPGEPQAMQGPGAVKALVFLPDGKRVATAHDSKALILWQVETGLPVGQVELPAVANALGVLPDGSSILAATGRTIRLVDVATLVTTP